MRRRFVATTAVSLLALGAAIVQRTEGPALAAAVVPIALPQRLVETGLYGSGSDRRIAADNRSFSPQYPLWSDGLEKKRWVYLPPGSQIDARDGNEWEYPVGTKFWKEFSLDGRKIETRLMWKASEAGWIFGTYMWNEAGLDAVLAPDEGVPGTVPLAGSRGHSIPSRSDCTACHSVERGPLGFNALQLSTDRDPGAIHGEPLQPGMLTLQTLIEDGRVAGLPDTLARTPPRILTASAETRSLLGYLAANCGSCHNGRGEISAVGPTIRWPDLLADGDAVARSLAGQPTRWQVPGAPEGASVLVRPGAPEHSALLVRMRSRAPSSQMPPLGTVIRDERATEALGEWIARWR